MLDALLGEDFNPSEHPRGWHGRWIGKTLHVFHGSSKITEVSHSDSRERMLSAVQGAVRARPGRPAIDRVGAQRVVDLASGPVPAERSPEYRGLGETPIAAGPTSTYRERRMARADRLEGWAGKREARARAGYEAGRAQVAQIPLGQPIHGPADRRRREKSFAKVERSFADQRKAESMRSRADEIRRQADRSVYSDDPDAVKQLKQRLSDLEAQRDQIKAYNATAKKAVKSGGKGDLSLLTDEQRTQLAGHRRVGAPFIGPGDAFPSFTLRNLQGQIKRTRDRLAQLGKAQEGALGALLEGFAAPASDPFPDHAFTTGDQVRVSVGGGAKAMVGRVMRPHGQPPTHAVISPEGGGAHVLAPVGQVKLNTPAQHAAAARRQEREQVKQEQSKATAAWMAAKPPGVKPPGPVRESIGLLVEAFAPSGANIKETPAQSQKIGAAQVAAAKAWNANQHPRGAGGKFSYSTGGKRGTRSSASSGRYLGTGSSGALVKSVQRQLHVSADGQYGQQTRAAVERYQRQHGLRIDGVIGRQTLAALRGHPKPATVSPGPISSRAARLRTHPSARPKAPIRISGGQLV